MNPTEILPYNFSDPITFLALTGLMFLAVTGRYFLLSGLFHLTFYVWLRDKWQQRRLSRKTYPAAQFRREIGWSVLTAAIFAVTGALMAVAWQKGYTAIYTDFSLYGPVYFVFSILVAMFVHETYYYWLHRWMHHPRVFRYVHRVHHESKITSAWTAFSFHPVEGLLEAVILPAILFVLPMHPYAIVTHLTIMTLSAAINHLDVEIYPKRWYDNPLGRWIIGATHHSHHHRYFKFNYGLYFTFWDKWAKTESPSFEREFREKTEVNTEMS
jgi:sterol desaturase/sphingolipid hydroxylase (fatty acid hydroxylase superfamily)